MEKSINKLVVEYVEKEDISSTRKALSRIAYSDHPSDFERFKASYQYAESKIGSNLLFEENNDDTSIVYSTEKELTTSDYMESVRNLMDNFSETKVKDVLKIGEKVFKPQRQEKVRRTESSKKTSPLYRKPQATKQEIQMRVIIGAAIVGVGVIVAAILIKSR